MQVVLAPFVEATISKVISVATEQLSFVVGFKEELRSFCVTLEMARGLLEHAEQKKAIGDPGVKVWLKELRRIADEADVVVDEIAYEGLKRKASQQHIRKQVKYFFTPSNPLAVRRRMASKINDLNAALAKVNTQANGFGLQSILANKKDPQHRGYIPQTDAVLGDPSWVVGREGDAHEISRLLIEPNNDQPLRVVSVVGAGGLGKTTLAKLVCNDDRIKRHFFKIMWICVSENFDVFTILGEMLQSLTNGSSMGITNQNAVVEKIKNELKEKNFLLVLDDVWNEDERKWENLRNCLLGITENSRSSRVMVTTRLPKVASIMKSLQGNIMQLDDDDCWSIIKRQAFNDSDVPSILEEIGRKIAIKCRGVPLVANVVGGTLRGDRKEEYWLSVEKDFDSCGPLVDDDRVLHVLKLSFDRLPRSALKQCFAFCSFFPKDLVMEMEMVVQLWMAQGFLQQPHGTHKEMEVIGEEYFTELISLSFFQDVERDVYGRVISCKLHDLMHDLAKSISNSETMVLEDSGRSDIQDVLHLNLVCAPSIQPARMVEVIQGLHSLFSKVDVFCEIPIQFKRLLVLSFRGADIHKLPSSLGKLKRLRYLDISGTKLTRIPRFIRRLYHLQTFRFMCCYGIKRPLQGMESLSNLKHICFDDERLVPKKIGSLARLQTLPIFVVGQQEGHGIEELENLSKLKGTLRISKLGNVRSKAEAMRAKLFEKSAITELELNFLFTRKQVGDLDEDVLEGLKPHSNLKGLKLVGHMGKTCPSWLLETPGNLSDSVYLKNLTRLQFEWCLLLKNIPPVSLSNLMVMKIYHCAQLESIGSLTLNKVAKLKIKACNSLKSVAISSLQSLKIADCDELVSVDFGSLAVESLKEIDITGCDKLESLSEISGSPVLEKLNLLRCANLRCIGGSGTSFASSNSLVELTLSECPNLMSIPRLDGIASLQKISLCRRQQFESIEWDSLLTSTCLKVLSIQNCDDLPHLLSLDTPEVRNHQQLNNIAEGSFPLSTWFIELSISKCPILTSICLDGSTCLEKLSMSECPNLASVSSLDEFTSLRYLALTHCGISTFPSGLSSLLHLSELELGGFSEELEEFPDLGFMQQIHSSLKILNLIGWEKLKHLPCQIQCLSGLQKLSIEEFSGLESLPDWLGSLSSLQVLRVSGCNSLMHMPSTEAMQRLSNLRRLCIRSCPALKARCAKESGSEWKKISHIPAISIDDTHIRKGGPLIFAKAGWVTYPLFKS